MFEKNLNVALLLDFYGDVLSARNRRIMEDYYCDDLSLSEIAKSEGISRQAIRHTIKKCEEELLFLEEKLGLAGQLRELKKTAEDMTALAMALEAFSEQKSNSSFCPSKEQILSLAARMKRTAAVLLEKPTEQEERCVSKPD